MPLPNSLTTVTPLSKALAAALFIIFPFIGFYLGIQYQKGITPLISNQVTPSPTPQTIYTPTPITQEGMFCGGIGGKPCGPGFTCQITDRYPDAGGKCVRDLPPRLDNPADQTICTQEAKTCPDGSYVSRQGPQCEFAVCPRE